MNSTQINGNGNPPATSAKQWKKQREEGYTIQLPSENWATLRPVPLDQLLEQNRIPDFLTPVAAKQLWTEDDANTIAANPDLHLQYLDLINFIVPLAMIQPAVVDDPDPEKEEISLKDIDFADKITIFNLSISPAVVLKSFRNQQASDMASTRDGENLQPAPLKNTRSK